MESSTDDFYLAFINLDVGRKEGKIGMYIMWLILLLNLCIFVVLGQIY